MNLAVRIVHLNAGAGSMYCGSCLHGSTLAVALRQIGIDVALVPLYTPLHTEEPAGATSRVAFGGLNVFLEQWTLFRHMPAWLNRWLDHPPLLEWLGRRSGSTRPEKLGPLCVSMLAGETGRQRRELEKLLDWLQSELRPDLVHLSTVLLTGVAREITRRLNIPVVATLSGEDLFLAGLQEPYRSQAQALLRERTAELAGLTALNTYYADVTSEYLGLARDRITVIRPGVNVSGCAPHPPLSAALRQPPWYTIGYLARIAPEKGLHLAAEALAILADDAGLPPVRLRVAGSLSTVDRPYLAKIQRRLAQRGRAERFEYVGAVQRAAKIDFLQSLDVLCLPTVYRESKGLPVLEAWANGVPVVVPEHGTFPELLADTAGGLLCRPNDPGALADALRQFILDPALAHRAGCQGHAAVHGRYHARRMADDTSAWYQQVLRDHIVARPG